MTEARFSLQHVPMQEDEERYFLHAEPHFQYQQYATASLALQSQKQYTLSMVQAAWHSLRELESSMVRQQQDAIGTAPTSRPQAVANFFLDRAKSCGKSLTPLKLIKLVCIAHGWSLAVLNRPLFHEPLEAWSFGPVVPSLYHEFKIFRKTPIDRYAFEYDFEGNTSVPKISPSDTSLFDLLERVWDIYRDYSAAQLVQLTHQEGTPWSVTKVDGRQIIDNGLIAAHYRQLLQDIEC